MTSTWFKKLATNIGYLALVLALSSLGYANDACVEVLSKGTFEDVLKATENDGEGLATARAVEAFAREHGLPTQVVKFGPAQNQSKRLVVALDITNVELFAAYRERFQLDRSPGVEGLAGTLAVEFQTEKVNQSYVTGVLRAQAGLEDPVYRWGRKDIAYSQWWRDWMIRPAPERAVIGFGHVIGLNQKERDNFRDLYLKDPEQRGACKQDNCVAWVASMELGITKKESTTEERRHLFNALGMARASAHFEIGRRLVYAANQRHSAMFVFVNGKAGLEVFTDKFHELLPPLPQISLDSVIKNFRLSEDSPLYKAVAQVPDGARVLFPIAAGASDDAMRAVVQLLPKLEKGLELHFFTNGIGEATLNKSVEFMGGKLKVRALFLGSNLRSLHQKGLVDVVPGYLSDFPRAVEEGDPAYRYDAIVVKVAPPDQQGRYSLGPNHDMVMTVLRAQPGIKVIAEINEKVPRTQGENFLTADQITASFKGNGGLASPPKVPLTQVEVDLAKNLAEIIPDGSYLQTGIGNIFDYFGTAISVKGQRNLKIWTEMFGDHLMQLVSNGNASAAKTGFAFGSEQLYRWLDNNEKVEFASTLEVNDPGTVSKLPSFHAINTALQVSLKGDSNAEMGDRGRRISSPGGQVEFMSGAARSRGGKAIIAIRSTAKNGELSSIVLDTYGGYVTTPHQSVTHVVTEYGVAELKGKSERERAINLIRIAHPKFRNVLFGQALERGILKELDLAEITRRR